MKAPVRVIRFPAPATVDPAVHELILAAIHEKRLLRFVLAQKARIVEPHDYGIHRGVVRLLVYQVAGSSGGPLPDWRWIDVPRISSVDLLDQTFAGSRAVSGNHHQWDVLFARVDHV